jgi:hypothetical protein
METTVQMLPVAPDCFDVAGQDALLCTELDSALAVCLYDSRAEAGALLHLRVACRPSLLLDLTENTLATEVLLLERCLRGLRRTAPAAQDLRACIIAHTGRDDRMRGPCEASVALLDMLLANADVIVASSDVRGGATRRVRFRPALGTVELR